MYTFASLGNNMVRNESIAPDANRLNYVWYGPAKELALVFLGNNNQQIVFGLLC
jgi:hypothetical protein